VVGGSFIDAVRRRQAAGFVARTDELARFRTNLGLSADDPDRRFVFSVYGDGGVGKTFLTQRLRAVAEERGAATGWVDDRVFGVPEAMRAISADLSRAGEDMTAFDKLLRNYLERRSEVEADPDAPAGAASFITKTAVRVGLHAAHAVPGIGGVADSIDADAAAEQADKLRSFLGKKFRSHEDVRLLLSPAEVLSPAFVDALARAARRRTLALFFDTYEQTGAFLDGWLRSLLHCDYGDVPENMIVTVAGRHRLDPNDWGEYAPVLANVPLAPFTEAEARQLLTAKGVTDERVVEVILNVSGRLPLLVAMLAENQPTDPGQVGDPSGDAVERFLKWIANPERRSLAVTAALPRAVSEDILGLLTSGGGLDDTERGQLYAWLRSLPFVARNAGRCTYHEVVRTAMIRLERSQSPMRWRERHQTLAEAFRQWRLAVFAEDAWKNSEWVAYRLEESYHLLCADPAGQIFPALTELIYAVENGPTTAAKWVQMILQAGGDRDAAAVSTWGKRLEETLTGSRNEAKVGCLSLLLRERQLLAEEAVYVALRTRGRGLCFLDREDEGLSDLDAAVGMNSADKHSHLYRGDCYRLLGRNEEALKDLDRAIELDPDFSHAIASRGAAYASLGRHDEAITDFTHAIELDPNFAWAITQRGQTYHLNEQYDQAITDFTRAIQLNPNYTWAITQRGETHRLAGRHEEAITDFTRAIQLNPDNAWAIGSRGQAYRTTGRYDLAINDFTRAIQLDPNYTWAITQRGQTYHLNEQYDQAITDFTRAIQLNPNYTWAITQRGETHRLAGRHEEAITDFTRAIQLNPDNAWAIASRGQTYSVTGQYDLAINDLTRSIQLDSDNVWAQAERGHVYRLSGRYAEALVAFNQAIEQDDNDWYRFQRFLVLCCHGEHEEGAQDLEVALRIVSAQLESDSAAENDAYNLTVYRAAGGELAQARADLARAIERFPVLLAIREAMGDLRDLSGVPGMDAAGITRLIEMLDEAGAAIGDTQVD
jgi:tetratricopeptide (TPR) repeat protein